MNSFMNALYQHGEGSEITGIYCEQPFAGRITQVRSTYGNDLNVYIDLEESIAISENDTRDSLVLAGSEIFAGDCAVAKNLHVYFEGGVQ